MLDHADLPNSEEALRVRLENAQRVSGDREKFWDQREVRRSQVSRAGHVLRLRTSRRHWRPPRADVRLRPSNYCPNQGLKVFKPRSDALERIVNYPDPRTHADANTAMVRVGAVGYASSHRAFQQVDGVPLSITPTDLLVQKAALFGMTRTGKSNTTKIVLKAIFELRWQPAALRIGQIIFDPNGEHANENAQAAGER